MSIWDGYREAVFDTFPDLKFESNHTTWKNKREVNLTADLYSGKYFIKSRHVDIWDGTVDIHNNIIYPKTGHNLPCYGMDLMGFNKKKCIIVFDFQHPVENYLLKVPPLPQTTETYRFFEKGNHFSDNIFVRYCKPDEVDEHLDMFVKYLTTYKDMIELEKPTGTDTSVYKDFDAYMTKLDPVGGYLSGKFGKDKAESLVNDFLFCYG
mgnify:CR=1 FL=1